MIRNIFIVNINLIVVNWINVHVRCSWRRIMEKVSTMFVYDILIFVAVDPGCICVHMCAVFSICVDECTVFSVWDSVQCLVCG